MESPRAVTSIPSVSELRKKLEYGDRTLARTRAFLDVVRVFKGKFTSSQGQEGTSFHNWRSFDHQRGLNEMTEAFLDHEGYGALFWPDDPSSPRYNRLHYSEHRSQIRKLVKQHFFKMNLNQHKNTTHRQSRPEREEPRPNERGASRDNPIDLNDNEPDTQPRNQAPASAAAIAPLTSHQSSFDGPRETLRADLVDPALTADPASGANRDTAPERDPFSVPQSPASNDPGRLLHTFRFAPFSPTTSEDTSARQDLAEALESANRSRTYRARARPAPRSAEKPRKKRVKRSGPPTDRILRSPGQRRARRVPDRVPDDELNAYLASEPSTDVQSDAGNGTPAASTSRRNGATAAMPPPAPIHTANPLLDEETERALGSHVFPAPFADMTASPNPLVASAAATSTRTSTPTRAHAPEVASDRGAATSHSPAPYTEVFNMFEQESSMPAPTVPPPSPRPPLRRGIPRPAFVSPPSPSPSPSVSSQPQPQPAPQPTSQPQSRAQSHSQTPRPAPPAATPPPPPTSTPPPPSARKPNITFHYHIIHSRTPEYEETVWEPVGRFSEKRVSELESEMPLEIPSDAKGWRFTLRGAAVHVIHTVRRGQQDDFNYMMARFDTLIRDVLSQKIGEGHLVFTLEIEAWTDTIRPIKKVEKYQGDLGW